MSPKINVDPRRSPSSLDMEMMRNSRVEIPNLRQPAFNVGDAQAPVEGLQEELRTQPALVLQGQRRPRQLQSKDCGPEWNSTTASGRGSDFGSTTRSALA